MFPVVMPPDPDLDARALAARLVCFGFDGLAMNAHCERMIDLGCGAAILFARNIDTPKQVAQLTAAMKRRAWGKHHRKLLVMVDQEGGRVARFSRKNQFTTIPSAAIVGNSKDPVGAASAVGDVIGEELRRVNVDMTLAPVVDVNTNPKNAVIGDRAFGSTPETVGACASAFIAALQRRSVAGCAKHWPGHGDTAEDSHSALPVFERSEERLRAVEIPPFLDVIAAGVASVLVAHLRVPCLEAGGGGEEASSAAIPPASCSPACVGLLRDAFGYDGVVMSDDMEMGALAEMRGGLGGCAVSGLRARVDLFLVCHSERAQVEVVEKLAEAIGEGNDSALRQRAVAALVRLDSLNRKFVDGPESAEANAALFDAVEHARNRVGRREDARRIEIACGVSRL